MIARILILAAPLSIPGPGADPVACELVDLPAAETVLDEGTINAGGDSEPSVCMYRDDRGTMLIVQVFDAGYYDVVTIGSGTPADVGDRGRISENESGAVTVQFARGDYSVTMIVRPMTNPESSFLQPMLDLARVAADRMP